LLRLVRETGARHPDEGDLRLLDEVHIGRAADHEEEGIDPA